MARRVRRAVRQYPRLAGVNSAARSFGLSFGLAFAGAVMLATLALSFTNMAQANRVLPPTDKVHVATVLEEDAQIMSRPAHGVDSDVARAQLARQVAGQAEQADLRGQ